jgi:hypothetical protein
MTATRRRLVGGVAMVALVAVLIGCSSAEGKNVPEKTPSASPTTPVTPAVTPQQAADESFEWIDVTVQAAGGGTGWLFGPHTPWVSSMKADIASYRYEVCDDTHSYFSFVVNNKTAPVPDAFATVAKVQAAWESRGLTVRGLGQSPHPTSAYATKQIAADLPGGAGLQFTATHDGASGILSVDAQSRCFPDPAGE